MKKILLSLALIAVGGQAGYAQYLKSGQINHGRTGTEFRISDWTKGTPWSEDDNFFISRVKPKARFTNVATQINQKLVPWWDWDYNSTYSSYKDYSHYSKKVLNWFPYGFSYSYATKSPFEILPNGIFNSEVFSMWQYISTWGAWSDHFMRLPGNFADVAHKNGVAVATQSTTAFGADMSTNGWGEVYIELGSTEENRQKVIEFLDYYGIDGIGYNSEFAGGYASMGVPEIVELNKAVSKHFETKYVGEMKSFAAENIWYDGVTMTAGPTFDNGVCEDTEIFFGDADNKTSSFFLNYNWNGNFNNGNNEYLPSTLEYAAKTLKRNPFDVYATFDLQGGSPKLTGNGEINGRWQYLDDKAVSIGLWSGHDSNTFWENRFNYGSKPVQVQQTYQRLLERWWTNSKFNPIYVNDENLEVDSNIDNSLDTEFFGLSKFVAAQSTLCWDLSKEPFISCFNMGNGEYFNWQGRRQHSSEWFNIGVQDYLPTWRWWWASEPLGRNFNAVPTGLTAECAWNDAWFGGSSLRISGSESARSVLHLFKTKFALQAGDVITVRYKINRGHAECGLLLGLGADCSEWTEDDYAIFDISASAYPDWQEKKFVVGSAEELAVIALEFKNATNLDVNIGEISIVRGEYKAVDTPVVTSSEVLATHAGGVDAKVIFDMNTAQGNNQGHYNIDHNASMYKLYSKVIYADGEEVVTLMGCTTSWAGLFFSAPFDALKTAYEGAYFQVGVSALGLDMTSESEIAWGEAMPLVVVGEDSSYECSDAIAVSDSYICDGDTFTIGYKDALHAPSQKWTLTGPFNNPAYQEPSVIEVSQCVEFEATADVDAERVTLQSLPYGFYNLSVVEADGSIRNLHSVLNVYAQGSVAQPQIIEFTALDNDDSDAISEVSSETAANALLGNFPDNNFISVDEQGCESDLRDKSTTLPGAGIKLRSQDTLTMMYKADSDAVADISQAINLSGYSLGVRAAEAGVKAMVTTTEEGEGWEKVTLDESKLSFAVTFWVKFTDLSNPAWLMSIRNPQDEWPYSAWGWLWGSVSDDGTLNDISIRSQKNNTYVYNFKDENGKARVKFEENAWYHVAYVFDEYKTTESSYYGIITDAENQFSLYINGELIEPTSISEPNDVGWKDFDSEAIIGIGGTAAVGAFAGYDASIDNIQFYATALDAEGVVKSMGDIDLNDSPAGLTALWDFEGDDVYSNKASTYPDAILNHDFSILTTSAEDVITAGYPGLKGSNSYKSEVTSKINVAGAIADVVEEGVDDDGNLYGYAEVKFPDPGESTYKIYTAKLNMTNNVAEDNAEYNYIYVVNLDGKILSGIVGVNVGDVAFDVYPNPFSRTLNVAIEMGGEYTLQLVNLDGKLLASTTCKMADKGVLSLDTDVDNGVYIAILLKDKMVVGTKKLIKE